jgi:threonine dehydratase
VRFTNLLSSCPPTLPSPSYLALHTVIHPRAVTEFIYRFGSADVANIFVSFKLDGRARSRADEVATVLAELEAQEMKGHDISDDELAKSHARYMIGGRSVVENERVFRFREDTSLQGSNKR